MIVSDVNSERIKSLLEADRGELKALIEKRES
jgi:hypothetical protein